MLKQGDTYGGCRIISRCGHGASGTVYLAEDAMGRRVAIKVFDSPEAGERELKGIRHYMSIHSPSSSLIAIYHVGIEDGQLYYVMEAADNAAKDDEEYVADTLALRMKRHGQFQPQEAFRVVQHLLDGLETLHNAHLIHRDIKPENILFIHGQPCLGDPGVVGDFSHTLSLAGSLGFIPPELFNATSKPSPNTDLYALGKVLYCLVTGRNAGDFPSMPPDMPYETLMQVCLPLERMCNSNPSRRCLACSDFREQLQEAMMVRRGFVRFLWRLRGDRAFTRKCLLWVACAIIVLLCLWGGAFSWHRHHLRQQEIAALRHKAVAEQLSTLRERQPLLDLQMEPLQETLPWEATFKAVETALAQKNVKKAQDVLGKFTEQICNIALRHRPPRITSKELNAETILQNGRQFGYLSSPLGKWYLPQEARQVLQNEADSDAKALFANGPIVAGKVFSYVNGTSLNFQFVPPGRFMSPITHTVQEINAPYWILETELTIREFKRQVLWPSGEDDLSELPITGLTLNDTLVFCKRTFELMKTRIDLPPGYALRLPTEAEWDYAALGGSTESLPPARALTKEEKVLCAVGSGEPNALGLYQMDANVPEMVLPYPETNVDAEYVAWRGGNFKGKKASIVDRTLERRDQVVVRHCGLRVVLAPTPDDYYQKTYYNGSRLHYAQLHGKAYAVLALARPFLISMRQ
ncbi:MAG: protein kinase [Victivallales bacterium]|nr:protein kinase [Victivallales bacterium]